MKQLLNIPHRTSHGMCPANGIHDLVHWRTSRDWSNEFLWGLGQGGAFAYLRFNAADPPRQMYIDISTPRQQRYLAELFEADFTESENRAFRSSWGKALQALDGGMPPVLGPMDMFHWKNDVKRYACFACINYCPSRAIQIQSKFPIRSHTDVNDRYHHRFVTFKDIAGQR
jgi:hypothetical protein